MTGPWDKGLKRLIHAAPQDFDTLVLPGAVLEEELPTEFVSSAFRMDALHKVRLNGEPMLLHLEFQKQRDSDMAERLLEYNVRAILEHHLPVWSCVMYIDTVPTPAVALISRRPDGRQALRFDFQVINLRDLSVDDLLATGHVGLYPLLPLARDGKRIEVVERMIGALVAHDNDRHDLLSFAYLFSALTFTDEDHQTWLKRRFAMFEDILEESWAYKELVERGLQKGLQKGREQGRQEGLQEGRHEAMAQAVLTVVEGHFPTLLPQANVWVERVHDPAVLQHLLLLLVLARSVEEAERILNSGAGASS